MSQAARWVSAVSLAAILNVLPLAAVAQQPQPNPNQPPAPKRAAPVQGQPRPPGPPGAAPQLAPQPNAQFRAPVQGAPVQGGPPGQFRGPGQAMQFQGGGQHGQFQGGGQQGQFQRGGPPGQFHGAYAIGERGYSFRGGYGRRDIGTFNERERAAWYGGRWRHEQHFGRYGYWWEVNGVWYFYDQPMAGPPAYVSDMEFMDDDLDGPVVYGEPAPVMVVPPPVVYVRPPPPPVVCFGPLCVR
jgi:hypothetical protein